MASPPMRHDGRTELGKARGRAWQLYGFVGLFSFAVNMLMLTGPLFMMQVYDRVLASRSVETLTALFLLVVFLFALMGVLDLARNRIMARVAARFQERMEGRVLPRPSRTARPPVLTWWSAAGCAISRPCSG